MKKSNNKGFTLVELVVVIAIIGVLAAILVPSMMGYVKKSRLKTANGNAKTAYNAAAEWVAQQETNGTPVNTSGSGTLASNVNCTGAKPSATVNSGLDQVVWKALSSNGNESGYVTIGYNSAIGGETPIFAHWRKTTSDKMIGQYPEASKDVETAEKMTFGTWSSQ